MKQNIFKNKNNLNNKIFFLKKKNFIIQKTFSIIFFFFDSNSDYIKKNKSHFLNYGFYSYFFPKNSLNLKTGSLNTKELTTVSINLLESLLSLKNLYSFYKKFSFVNNDNFILKKIKIIIIYKNFIFFNNYLKILKFLNLTGNLKMRSFLNSLNSSEIKTNNLNKNIFQQKFNFDVFSFNGIVGHYYFYTKNFFFFRRFCVDFFFRSEIFFNLIQKKKISIYFFKFFKKFKKINRNLNENETINFYENTLNIFNLNSFEKLKNVDLCFDENKENIHSTENKIFSLKNQNYYLSSEFFFNFFFNKEIIPFGLTKNFLQTDYENNFFFLKNTNEEDININFLLTQGSHENLKFLPLSINFKNQCNINFKNFFSSFFLKETTKKNEEKKFFDFFLNFFIILQTIPFGSFGLNNDLKLNFLNINYFNYKTFLTEEKKASLINNNEVGNFIVLKELIEILPNQKENFFSNFCNFNKNYLNYFYLSGGIFFFFKDFYLFFLKHLFFFKHFFLNFYILFFKKFLFLLIKKTKKINANL